MRVISLLFTLLLSPISLAASPCPEGNLLAKKQPSSAKGISQASRLTDGIVPEEGGNWKSEFTSKLNNSSSQVTYDLGQVIQIRSLLVQGDNNDSYQVSGSLDGKEFLPIWEVPHTPQAGMQTRLSQGHELELRYLRIGEAQGDNAFSLGEIQAFCQHPKLWPPALEVKKSSKDNKKNIRKKRMARGKMTVGFLGLLAFIGLFLGRKREEPWRRWLTPGAAAAALAYAAWMTWQDGSGTYTVISLLVLLLGALWWKQDHPHWGLWAERSGMLLLILASATAWVNFGTFHGSRAIHYWDTFHYYVGSKYFQENGYEKLYKCASIAEIDDGRAEEVLDRKMRDLKNNALGPAKEQLIDQSECRLAFTPKRWAAFRQDLRLFRSFMGTSWWQKMFKDHGYNPTPVWSLVGSRITNLGWEAQLPPNELVKSPANLKGKSSKQKKKIRARFKQDRKEFESRVKKIALLDATLYLSIFLLIYWAFGLRTVAFAMVVWGCGYPWAYFWTGGSFGRVPWIFFSVLGVALLRKGYRFLGGGAITWAALHRIFPAALAGGVTLQILWNFYKKRRITQNHLRIVMGATLTLAILIPVSGAVVGDFNIYPNFIENSLKHKDTPLTNNMGLPTLVAYHPDHIAKKTKTSKFEDPFHIWKKHRKKNKEDRVIFYGLGLLAIFGLILYIGRHVDEWEITAMSIIFIIAIFELTCYYYTFMILLAPIAIRKFRTMVVLLGMSILSQYLQLKIGWYDEQYTAESLLVFVAALYILIDRALEFKQVKASE